MNEIIIMPGSMRQVIGPAAHTLAYGPDWDKVGTIKPGWFYVFEGSRMVCSCPTLREAYGYLTDERVMIYWQ